MKKSLLSLITLGLCTSAMAQNPIIRDQFTADPTAKVFNGRVYLFPSHDIPAPDDYGRKDWFCMADYHVFSSENLTDWTDHGVIVDQKNVEWGNPKGYSMWAPDCVEKDGKYYFYFPNGIKPREGQRGGGFGIGVAIADLPEGPYRLQSNPIEGVSGIDPCVLRASDGNNYIYWGGGNLRGAKLKDNLLELSEDSPFETRKFGEREVKMIGKAIDTGLPAGFKEGTFVFERQGKFYLTYPWVEDKTETLAYAMSDDPLGPFEFKGKIMEQSPTGCWTNHHSIVEYKGQWYLFYHHNDYSPNFDKLRSVRCDSLFFNPDGTIQLVKPTLRGVGLVDARKPIQIDRYSTISPTGARIDYLNPDTTKRFDGWQIIFNEADAYSTFNKVDFGTQQVNLISVRVKAPKGGKLIIRNLTNRAPGRWGNRQMPAEFLAQMGIIATIDIPETKDFSIITLPINNSPRGIADLKIQSADAREVAVDWIGFELQPEAHPALLSTAPLQPWQKGGFETKQYRNLFAELGYSQQQIDKKLDELFYELFEGPDRIYFELPNNMAIISDVKNHDARTEGMSYGMMIAVQLNKKEVFDRLFRWAKEYMQMKDGNQKGYFAWSVKPDGTGAARGAAADGELYFVTSLIFASNRWGNDTGINYLKEAQYIIDCCMGKDGQPRLIDEKSKLIAFTPGSTYTDPSYHIPAFYEVWAKYANDGRSDYWNECAKAAREYLHKSVHPITGLNPDYNNFDGSMMRPSGGANNFRYDSWRVPMNIALDFSWSNADAEWQTEYGNKLQNFLYNQGIDSFYDQYNVDGTIVTDTMAAGGFKELRHTPGFIATSAALSLVTNHSKGREFVDRFWNNRHDPTPSGYKDAYYEGILRLFAAMHLSGRYQVIEPKKNAAAATKKTTTAAKPKAKK